MYAYIVDGFLHVKKYQTELFRIESRLSQLGIQGRMEKITILKNLLEAAQETVRRGATTIVAIGNDQTLIKLLPVAIDRGVILGIIPLGEPQAIAASLGIPNGLPACDVISRRIIRRLDVGQADGSYFLLEARLTGGAPVKCDGRYTVESTDPNSQILIGNLGTNDPAGKPTDGRLELIVRSSRGVWPLRRKTYNQSSVFPIRQAAIGAQANATLLLDGQVVLKTPLTVGVAPKKLGMIVGRTQAIE